MKIVYIAHPVSNDVKTNLELIACIVKKINLTYDDVVPFVPYYADCVAMDDRIPEHRMRGIKNDLAILESGIVNEIWLYGNKISAGVQAEIEWACENSVPVIIMDDRLKTGYNLSHYDNIISRFR